MGPFCHDLMIFKQFLYVCLQKVLFLYIHLSQTYFTQKDCEDRESRCLVSVTDDTWDERTEDTTSGSHQTEIRQIPRRQTLVMITSLSKRDVKFRVRSKMMGENTL